MIRYDSRCSFTNVPSFRYVSDYPLGNKLNPKTLLPHTPNFTFAWKDLQLQPQYPQTIIPPPFFTHLQQWAAKNTGLRVNYSGALFLDSRVRAATFRTGYCSADINLVRIFGNARWLKLKDDRSTRFWVRKNLWEKRASNHKLIPWSRFELSNAF